MITTLNGFVWMMDEHFRSHIQWITIGFLSYSLIAISLRYEIGLKLWLVKKNSGGDDRKMRKLNETINRGNNAESILGRGEQIHIKTGNNNHNNKTLNSFRMNGKRKWCIYRTIIHMHSWSNINSNRYTYTHESNGTIITRVISVNWASRWPTQKRKNIIIIFNQFRILYYAMCFNIKSYKINWR